jgi:hypothetical protein
MMAPPDAATFCYLSGCGVITYAWHPWRPQ